MKHTIVFTTLLIYSAASVMAQTLPLDYSYCGYHRSEQPIPTATCQLYVEPQEGDNSPLLQAAIDRVAQLKPDKQTGLRGAVLLGKGTFTLSQPLRISASGVVLRGSGRDVTILRKEGCDRGALLYMEGRHDIVVKDTIDLPTMVINTLDFSCEGTALKAGDRLMIWRPSTIEWIRALGCESFGGGKEMGYWAWHAGDIDLCWHRRCVSAGRLDAPITTAIEPRWGGGKAIRYEQPGLISECGVENLTLESDYDRQLPMDEDHCWDGIYVADAEDCWVRMVTFRHFAGSAVVVQKSARQVTVEDCKSLQPVSEVGGMRRRTFFTLGELTLFQRCFSEHGINDFAAGYTAPGPNAFVQCESRESLGPSGSIASWAPGLLFDCVNIDGNDLIYKNLELEKYGAGWNTANSTLWQSAASGIYCYSPDSTCRNYSYGCWGQIQGNGEYASLNEHVKPYSIFQEQLGKRLGRDVSSQCRVLERPTNASSSPTVEEAMLMAKEAQAPRLTMEMWIDSARFGDVGTAKPFVYRPAKTAASGATASYSVSNGRLTFNGQLLVGGKHQTPWWSGRLRDSFIPQAKYGLTRFVPGQEGTGYTDRVDSVVAQMQREHTLVFSQNYGLWYDRRRDDHERLRRKNGDVWGPFYEQPFARTGIRGYGGAGVRGYEETAWDGLSRYDLTRQNRWYFHRLRTFTEQTRTAGLLLKNQHYFQHNILEAGAHWVDCPWRTANNVNGTPFLEPVNFTGDKRIFTAELFYDVENPTLRQLHRQYIRGQLDAFRGQPNVIHSIGEEFTGPLHFVQFWLDVVSEWEQENGEQVLVALAVTKDVQDAILADEKRSAVVDIIDIEQWFRHAKGEYAPAGGVNMAPRQYQRKIRTGSARFEDVYQEVREYRERYPQKAVVYSAQKFPELCWASFMAGGSCAPIPVIDRDFLTAAATLQPADGDGCYVLKGADCQMVYTDSDEPKAVDRGYRIVQIDPLTGRLTPLRQRGKLPGKGVYWLKK